MPITLITGPANAGKAEVVMDAVRGHLAGGHDPLLIVPTRADALHYRRELAGEGAALGGEVQRFQELFDLVVRCTGDASAALGTLARERLLATLAAREDGALAAVARSGDFARSLGTFVTELQQARVTPARLRGALRAASAEHPSLLAVAALFERYLRALERIGVLDSEQRVLRALEELRRMPALWRGRPVLLYGFDDFTPMQLQAIETLGVAVAAHVTVSLTYEEGRVALASRAATSGALERMAAVHQHLDARAEYYAPGARGALSHLERSLFEPEAARVDPGSALRMLEGANERAELELVAGQIAELLDGGMAPGEIAVVMRTPPATADLLEEVFSAAGIPFSLERHRRFPDSAIGAALIGLLRCVPRASERSEDDEAGSARPAEARDLLAWLRAPGVLKHPQLADALEARLRRRGVSDGGEARALWEQRHWPLEAIDRMQEAQRRGARALCQRAARELEWLFSASRRRQARVLDTDELDEARALAAGLRALSELRELGRVSPEHAALDASVLADSLAAVQVASGTRPSPRSVAVLDPLSLRARRVRALFVCRLQEGVFPAAPAPRAVLGEEERRRLAQTSGLRLSEREDTLAAERYLLYAAVSRPEELLVLSWHAASDDGAASMRSLFVDDVCDLFERTLQTAPVGVRAAEGGSIRERPIAPLRDEGVLAGLEGHTWSASSLGVWMGCPVRWLVERMLRAEDLDPHPEPLARGGLAHAALKETLEGLRRETGSARITRGHLALARDLLARALEEGEEQFELSTSPESRPGIRRRLRADLERYLEHAASCAEQASLSAGAGTTAPAAFEPTHLELEFGFGRADEAEERGGPADRRRDGDGAEDGGEDGTERVGASIALPAFDLGGGVLLRGRVDRVDVGPSGDAVVYDYKGRSVYGAGKWLSEHELQVALYMRAIEQLLGARAVGGFYQPLAGSDLRARGVLELGNESLLECVGDDAREADEVRALLEQAVAMAREAAAQAARGELEPRPRTCAFKGGCMYPAICRCENSA